MARLARGVTQLKSSATVRSSAIATPIITNAVKAMPAPRPPNVEFRLRDKNAPM